MYPLCASQTIIGVLSGVTLEEKKECHSVETSSMTEGIRISESLSFHIQGLGARDNRSTSTITGASSEKVIGPMEVDATLDERDWEGKKRLILV